MLIYYFWVAEFIFNGHLGVKQHLKEIWLFYYSLLFLLQSNTCLLQINLIADTVMLSPAMLTDYLSLY